MVCLVWLGVGRLVGLGRVDGEGFGKMYILGVGTWDVHMHFCRFQWHGVKVDCVLETFVRPGVALTALLCAVALKRGAAEHRFEEEEAGWQIWLCNCWFPSCFIHAALIAALLALRQSICGLENLETCHKEEEEEKNSFTPS